MTTQGPDNGRRILISVLILAFVLWLFPLSDWSPFPGLWSPLLWTGAARPWTNSDFPPLENSTTSIRLLRIRASWWKGIDCKLETVSLEHKHRYQAFSYAWGDNTRQKSLLVNGKVMMVTETAWHLIENSVSYLEERAVWIDQICIDQNNVEEKNDQVGLMTYIYSRATEVHAFVGAHTAPHWIREASASAWTGDWPVRMANKYPDPVGYWLYLIVTEEYWKRCWVIQELVVARRIRIRVGSVSLSWANFIQLVNWYAQRQGWQAEVERILQLYTLRHSKHHHGEKFSLTRLVDTFQDSFCSNKLDKVFAFVGMADDCVNGCLDINYTASPYDLYRNLLLFHDRGHHLTLDHRVSMVYTARLTQSILSREFVLLPGNRRKPMLSEDINSFIYRNCGEHWEQWCIERNASSFILIGAILREGILWIWSLDQHIPIRRVAEWLPSTPESANLWLPATNSVISSEDSIISMDYLVLDKSSEAWHRQIDNSFDDKVSRKQVRVLGRLITRLLRASAIPLQSLEPAKFSTHDGDGDDDKKPRLFVAQSGMIGVISSNAKEGDLICQFWKSNIAAVFRRNELDERFQVVGRAVIARHPDYLEWDTPADTRLFASESHNVVDLDVSLDTLTALTITVSKDPIHGVTT